MTAGAELLEQANAAAQRRFRDMVAEGVYGDPDAAETQAYLQAERAVDAVMAALQAPALAAGDHHLHPEAA